MIIGTNLRQNGSSVGRAPDLQAGGRGFDPRPGLMTFLVFLLIDWCNVAGVEMN